MGILSKSSLCFAAGIAASVFVSYCVYFDKKRRSDPDYKRKVRQRRKVTEVAKPQESPSVTRLNFADPQAIERYFVQELTLGEKFIVVKNIDKGVEHLSNAILVCAEPARLLDLFRNTLDPSVFTKLVERIAAIRNGKLPHCNIITMHGGGPSEPRRLSAAHPGVLIDDLE